MADERFCSLAQPVFSRPFSHLLPLEPRGEEVMVAVRVEFEEQARPKLEPGWT